MGTMTDVLAAIRLLLLVSALAVSVWALRLCRILGIDCGGDRKLVIRECGGSGLQILHVVWWDGIVF